MHCHRCGKLLDVAEVCEHCVGVYCAPCLPVHNSYCPVRLVERVIDTIDAHRETQSQGMLFDGKV